MNMMSARRYATFVAALLLLIPCRSPAQIAKSRPDCISPAERKRVQQEINQFHQTFGYSMGALGGVVLPYSFYPQAGTLWQDLFIVNFVDLDPTAGILDWDGTDWTYNGHKGHDPNIASFDEQEIGVPIFAALDGTVAAAHDGEADHNTTWNNQPANYVVLYHGGTQYSYYWHMKKDSVAVAVGQTVKAGQQIGQTGSSGISTWPHLHFESHVDGGVYEPYAGIARPGPSNWVHQTPIRRGLYPRYFGISPEPMSNLQGFPWHFSRTGTFVNGLRTITIFTMPGSVPPNSTWRFRFLKPDHSLYFDSGTVPFTWDGRAAWVWWQWDLWLLNNGDWTILVDFNGSTLFTAPIKVVADAGEVVNRPPVAVKGSFDPVNPSPGDVTFVRLDPNMTADPDYDVVRYRYVWKRNAAIVRDVVSAALSDCVPHHTVSAGDTLTCEVTPSDGQLDGPKTTFTTRLGAALKVTFAAAGKVYGGLQTTGTVTLPGDAPPEGLTVSLTSGNPAVADVPDTVTVPGGQTSAEFAVKTNGVTARTPVAITAAADSQSGAGKLIVLPPAPKDVTYGASTVNGGLTAQAQVNLLGEAPAGGLVVSLSSSNPALASVPATVTVPEGSATASFEVKTSGVAVTRYPAIRASANGATGSGTLTIVPAVPVDISFSPDPVTGGQQTVATITLRGSAPAAGLVLTLASANPAIVVVPATVKLAAGGSSGSVVVKTQPVSTPAAVNVSATGNGATVTKPVTVTP